MFVYLAGDKTKGVVRSHTIFCNPGEHLGHDAVPSAWLEKKHDGSKAGMAMVVPFLNGKADVEDRLGEYLIDMGQALRHPWIKPDEFA